MIGKVKRGGERGQTIILVAISIVSLLAMAALAIDVVTLYVASSEIKRAADAAALAGAKAIADSGVTTLQASDGALPAAQALAASMANAAINAVLPANPVAGSAPACNNCPVTPNWNLQGNYQGNPTLTVRLTQTGLPTFFAKIWGRTGSTVSATSTAEVYNPSNNSSYTPIAPTAVKPWLVANADPYTGASPKQFINSANLVEGGSAIGETFDLTADCATGGSVCTLKSPPPPPYAGKNPSPPYYFVYYVPALVTLNAGNNVCPSCSSGLPFEQSIECADVATTYSCGSGGASFDSSVNPGGAGGPSALGAECLTQAGGPGPNPPESQDQLAMGFPNAPPQITAGTYAGNPYSGSLVSTSSSIVTIPIVDPFPTAPGTVTVVGFMQAFINGVEPGVSLDPNAGDIDITVLNISGCNATSNGNPPVVGGQGTSPVPVRLIAPPTP